MNNSPMIKMPKKTSKKPSKKLSNKPSEKVSNETVAPVTAVSKTVESSKAISSVPSTENLNTTKKLRAWIHSRKSRLRNSSKKWWDVRRTRERDLRIIKEDMGAGAECDREYTIETHITITKDEVENILDSVHDESEYIESKRYRYRKAQCVEFI